MRFIITIIICFFGQTIALAEDFETQKTWSARNTPTSWSPPPDGYHEGSILGIFTTSEPAEIIEGAEEFEQLADDTWQRLFAWDETEPIMAIFQSLEDASLDTIYAFPEPTPAMIPGAHSFPMVSLQTDPENLWSDSSGIYVWGESGPNWNQRGIEWERNAQMNMWNIDGSEVFSRSVGLRINGGWSRSLSQKSFRMYFDHHGAPEYLYHDFFDDGPTVSQRLLLRQTMGTQFILTDHWATSIYRQLGHLTSRWTPTVAYLNGEYWGIYSLRERLDDEWASVTLGYDRDTFILVKDGITEHGNPQSWSQFLNWVNDWSNPGNHLFFEGVSQRLDLVSYTDWIIINAFTANSENGFAKNLVILRNPDQRWNYVMWDEDDILYPENLEADLLRFYASENSSEYDLYTPAASYFQSYGINFQYCRLFRQLMRNAEYRTLFRHRADLLLHGVLEVANAQARFDSLVTMFEPELPYHAPRYPIVDLEHTAEAAAIYKNFIAQRHPIYTDQVTAFLNDFMAPVELSYFSATTQTDQVVLLWQTERERDNQGFEVWRAVEDSTSLELLATSDNHPELQGSLFSDDPRQYTFIDENLPVDVSVWYQLRHISPGGENIIHHWLEHAGSPVLPDLVINEFQAANNTTITDPAGEYDDWIELLNRGDLFLSLGTYFLTDDLNYPTKWELPNTNLRPGARVLIWCDNDLMQFGHHAPFKLSASGEQIGLFEVEAGHAIPIDTVNFGAQATDFSYGRFPDGEAQWQSFNHPTPGQSNNSFSAAPDGAIAILLSAPRISPNPSAGQVDIRFSSEQPGATTVEIFNARGYRVRKLFLDDTPAGPQTVVWNRRDESGRKVSSGVYLVQIKAAGTAVTGKIGVVR